MFIKFMRYMYAHREDENFIKLATNELISYLSPDEQKYEYAEKIFKVILRNEVRLGLFMYANLISSEVYYKGEPIPLTNTERMIVLELAENANRVVTYEELIKEIWGYSEDNSILKVNVSNIRNKANIPIHSVKGKGYMIIGA